MSDEIHLWVWRYTDDFGKRRTTRYLLTEEEAKQRLRDPEKVPHTLEIRRPDGGHTSDFMRALLRR